MKQIFQILKKSKPLEGDVGVEIEVEGANLGITDAPSWKTVDDGSLRGHYPESRAEYIFNKPLPHKAVKGALKELSEYFKATGSVLKFSFRTSVHVHINAHNLTTVQLANFIYLYLLMEEVLINYCGKERKGNRFCLRLRDAEAVMMEIERLINSDFEHIPKIDVESFRYSSCNVTSLKTHGSVEFRGMRGTIDVGVLSNWVDALMMLRTKACQFSSPIEIYNSFIKEGALGFFEKVLAEYVDILSYPKMEKDIYMSFSLAHDFPFQWRDAQEALKKKDEPLMFKANYFEPKPALEDIVNPVRRIRRPAQVVMDDILRGEVVRDQEVNDE